VPRPPPLKALCSPASSNLGHAPEAERSTALPAWARYAHGLGMLQRRGGALRLDGAHRLSEPRRRARLRRQLRVQGPASGPHRLIGQSTRKRAALTRHPKECIASRGFVRHRRRALDGACGGGGSHRLGCLPTGPRLGTERRTSPRARLGGERDAPSWRRGLLFANFRCWSSPNSRLAAQPPGAAGPYSGAAGT